MESTYETQPVEPDDATQADQIGGYDIPVDPMDHLGCDSCQ